MYSCKDCGRQFQGGLRINNISLWNDYLTANRTISDLSTLYKCSERTIRCRLSLVVDSFTATYPKSAVIILDTTYFSRILTLFWLAFVAVIILDTTYFSRTFGVMFFQDASSGKILYRKFVKNETNRDYLDGLRYIAERGTIIKAVVCDGHVGLLQAISFCPVQVCQFHQFQIIRRILTNNPHLPTGVELLVLMRRMFSMRKDEFITAFNKWRPLQNLHPLNFLPYTFRRMNIFDQKMPLEVIFE